MKLCLKSNLSPKLEKPQAFSIEDTNTVTFPGITKMWKIDTKENRKTEETAKKRKNKLAELRGK